MRASDFKRAPSEAAVFHQLAGPFLADLGFGLVNDPHPKVGRFNASTAAYQSPKGLSLCIGFEPGDSNTAEIACGREWSAEQQCLLIANHYSVLAKRFGIDDLPLFYRLGYGEETRVTMKAMLADLMRSLPIILPRVTLGDLLSIARDPPGG